MGEMPLRSAEKMRAGVRDVNVLRERERERGGEIERGDITMIARR